MLRTLVSAFIHTLLLHFWLLSFTLCHHFFHFCFSSDILGPSPSPCNFMFLSFYFPSLYSGCNQYKIQSEGFRQKKFIYFICSAFTGSENYHVTLTVLQDVKFGQNEYKLNEYFALHCNKKRKKKTGEKSLWKNSLYFTQIRHYRQYFPCCRVKDNSECDVNKLSWPDPQKKNLFPLLNFSCLENVRNYCEANLCVFTQIYVQVTQEYHTPLDTEDEWQNVLGKNFSFHAYKTIYKTIHLYYKRRVCDSLFEEFYRLCLLL